MKLSKLHEAMSAKIWLADDISELQQAVDANFAFEQLAEYFETTVLDIAKAIQSYDIKVPTRRQVGSATYRKLSNVNKYRASDDKKLKGYYRGIDDSPLRFPDSGTLDGSPTSGPRRRGAIKRYDAHSYNDELFDDKSKSGRTRRI